MKLKRDKNTFLDDLRSDLILIIIMIIGMTGFILLIASSIHCEQTIEPLVYDEIYGPPYNGVQPLESQRDIKEAGTASASWYDQTPLRSDYKRIAGNTYGVASAYIEHGTRYLVRLRDSADVIVVTVNDYCTGCESGFDEFRRFDLSKEAFEALDTLSTGVIEIEYMELKGEGLSI